MTDGVLHFVEKIVRERGPFKKVLDVGSRDISGTPKQSFPGSEYLGMDMLPGGNVDLVGNAHDIPKLFKKDSFDAVVCLETLEHDDKFWVTVKNLRWVLKPGGVLIITVPGPRCPKHEWPGDHWRFMEDGFRGFFKGFDNIEVVEHFYEAQGDPNPLNNELAGAYYGAANKPK